MWAMALGLHVLAHIAMICLDTVSLEGLSQLLAGRTSAPQGSLGLLQVAPQFCYFKWQQKRSASPKTVSENGQPSPLPSPAFLHCFPPPHGWECPGLIGRWRRRRRDAPGAHWLEPQWGGRAAPTSLPSVWHTRLSTAAPGPMPLSWAKLD